MFYVFFIFLSNNNFELPKEIQNYCSKKMNCCYILQLNYNKMQNAIRCSPTAYAMVSMSADIGEFSEYVNSKFHELKQSCECFGYECTDMRVMDCILSQIPQNVAFRHIREHCGVPIVTSDLSDVVHHATTSMVLMLDIDETLVDARSTCPAIFIRPYVIEMFARLATLRLNGIEVWLWTAGIASHAARCINALRTHVGVLPIDGAIVRGNWMSHRHCVKDTSKLPLGAMDRVLLIDNTLSMVMAVSKSSLVVPSYIYEERHDVECVQPIMAQVCDLVEELMRQPPETRVSDFMMDIADKSHYVHAAETKYFALV
jgi:hypothetical protein